MPPRHATRNRRGANSGQNASPQAEPPPPDPVIFGPQGRFLGSMGSVFTEQSAGDLYLQDVWTSIGRVHRIVVTCATWGISFAAIEEAYKQRLDEVPSAWEYDADALALIQVEDHGLQFSHRNDVHPHPNRHLIPAAGLAGSYEVGGALRSGYAVPWHHKVVLTATSGDALHWHQHTRRTGTGVPPIVAKSKGKHWVLKQVTYSTQVQNCRRAKGE